MFFLFFIIDKHLAAFYNENNSKTIGMITTH